MALTITKFTNHWTAGLVDTWNAHKYEVNGDTDTNYSYAEFMAAINSHADFTVTETNSSNSGSVGRYYQIARAGTLTGNNAAIILMRTGHLFHESPSSTEIFTADHIWMPLLGSEPSAIDRDGSNASQVSLSFGDTSWRSTHTINQGYVYWRFPSTFGAARDANNTFARVRPVDLGNPQKNPGRFFPNNSDDYPLIQSSLAILSPSVNQEFIMNGIGVMRVDIARSTQRQDPDIIGEGKITLFSELRSTGGGQAFGHYTNSHPDTTINVRLDETDDLNAFEVFSTIPPSATHRYLNKAFRTTSTHNVQNLPSGQFSAATAGADRFQSNAAANTNPSPPIMYQGVKTANFGVQYYVYTQSSDNNTDAVLLDPGFNITTDNAPLAWGGTNNNGTRNPDVLLVRTLGVRNRDSSGVNKSTQGYILGNQASASTRAFRGSDMQSRIPAIRTSSNGGTWSVREVDAETAIGIHLLHDATKEGGADTSGGDANHYTRLDDSDNQTYLLHRGGLQRQQQNLPLRSTVWNFAVSDGSGSLKYTNQADDVSGFSDNYINLFNGTLAGMSTSTLTIAANSTSNITLDGMSNLTRDEVTAMVGATAISGAATATIDSATYVNATSVTLDITAGSSSFVVANNGNVAIEHRGYTWDITSAGVFTLTPTAAKTFTYTSIAALIQSKLELIASTKEANLGTETADIRSSSGGTAIDATIAGTRTLNTLLARMTNSLADASYVSRGTATTTVNIRRFAFGTIGSNTVTLNADTSNLLINFGSSYTIPTGVNITGAYTDSNGTPSFVTLVLPSGVTNNDITASVAYQVDSGSAWRIGSNPSINTVGGVTSISIPENVSSEATGNTDDVWYLSITGSKTADFREQFTGSVNVSRTLTAETLRPTDNPTASIGTVSIHPYASDDSELAVNETYINNNTRIGLRLNGYDNFGSTSRLQLDVLEERDSEVYANYVARYGANPNGNIINAAGINLDSDSWLIDVPVTSKASYLLMNGVVATSTLNSVIVNSQPSATQAFFDTPDYDPTLVNLEVRAVVDPVGDRLAANQVRLSRGIPPRSTVST